MIRRSTYGPELIDRARAMRMSNTMSVREIELALEIKHGVAHRWMKHLRDADGKPFDARVDANRRRVRPHRLCNEVFVLSDGGRSVAQIANALRLSKTTVRKILGSRGADRTSETLFR